MPRILFLITDLDLGGSPLVVRDLAIGLRNLPASSAAPFIIHNSSFIIPFDPTPFRIQNSEFSLPFAPAPFIIHNSSFIIPFETAVCSLAPIAFPRGQVARMLEDESIPVHSLDASSARDLLPALARYRKLLQTFRPDIVYSVLIHANFLATLGKLSQAHPHTLIQSIHTLQPAPRWHWTLQGFLLPHADAVVAPSQAILDRLAQFGNFQNARVIPNGVDVPKFAAAEALESAPGAAKTSLKVHQGAAKRAPNIVKDQDKPLIIGYLGRFDPVKRIDLLIKSLAFLPDSAHLVLVGYGPAQPSLEKLATRLHLMGGGGGGTPRVHFVGPTLQPERWYKSFDIHALPSPVEGFGLTLAESLAAGTPVAAFRTPATAAIVRPGLDGALASELSERALALAIKEVTALLRSGRYDPRASQAWIAAHFSREAFIMRHANFLRKFAEI